MKIYQCELCGLEFTYTTGMRPRWCTEDRLTGRSRAKRARANPTLAITDAIESVITAQRLAIQQAIYALTLAALARQLEWDDRTFMQAALDHLTGLRTVAEHA